MPRAASGLLWSLTAAAALLVAAGAGVWEQTQRQHRSQVQAARLTGGDPEAGQAAIGRYGCGACHQIPGVPGAAGQVGPPLTGVSTRAYLAGRLDATPANLIRWIRDPQGVEPGTVMPDMGLSDAEARDIAAYLYTLR
ncbi:cytochrome c family protein [Caulobacter sp. 17J80-11]|uniref:c-type cytochrome n=1 Tax=Caulobacter sp. 17J80-11 TaxID=2763502 RepID=UPI0016534663|nr:c-type cytochrome [Caulobacter sp. 17J80-11]MBC6982559.1 c-type cytochrome [Caulobacter sp. 17J80-11]